MDQVDPDLDAARAGRTPKLPLDRVADVYRRYQEEKRNRGVIDFDDLIRLTAQALETDAEIMSNTQLAEQIKGQPPEVEAAVLSINNDARNISLQVALVIDLHRS